MHFSKEQSQFFKIYTQLGIGFYIDIVSLLPGWSIKKNSKWHVNEVEFVLITVDLSLESYLAHRQKR